MVQKATISHLEELSFLFDQYRVFYKKESDYEGGKAFLKERLTNRESIIFIAFREGKPAGFTQLYPKYSSARLVRNWILNDLYVNEDERREGIGELLIQAALTFAESAGAEFVQLETAIDNYTAQGLYNKMGFRTIAPDSEWLVYRKTI